MGNAAQKALEKLWGNEINGSTTPSTSQPPEVPTGITQHNNTSRQQEETSHNVSPPRNTMEQERATPIRDVRSDAPQNFVSEINNYCDHHKLIHDYKLVDQIGLSHMPEFVYKVIIDKREYPEGRGKNKTDAKQQAAQLAWNAIQEQSQLGILTTPSTSQPPEVPTGITQHNNTSRQQEETSHNVSPPRNTMEQERATPIRDLRSDAPQDFVSEINLYCQQHKLIHDYKLVDQRGQSHIPEFVYKVIIDKREYPEGRGNNKIEAKQQAAQLAWNAIQEQSQSGSLTIPSTSQPPEVPTGITQHNNTSRQQEESSHNVSPPRNTMEQERATPIRDLRSDAPQDFVSKINHYCQQHNLTDDYKLVDRRGRSHTPEFVYKVVIDKREYPEGCGKNKTEAKQQAAQLAWNAIQEQSQSGILTTPSTSQPPEVQTGITQHNNTSRQREETSHNVSPSRNTMEQQAARLAWNEMQEQSQSDSLDHSQLRLSDEDSPYSTPETESQDVNALRRNATSESDGIVFKDSSKDVSNKCLSVPNNSAGQATKSRFEEDFDFDSIECIGKGGFGRVFKARNKWDEAYYAVKIVKCTEKASREVIALAKLQHPHIVRYLHCWIEKTAYRHEGSDSSNTSTSGSDPAMSYLYIKMEWCEGDDLAMWIDEKNTQQDPHRRQEAHAIVTQIVDAVVYIHSIGLIHRDLKPANIMFGRDRKTVKIGDFGLVTVADNDDEESMMERTKRTGTKSYMSPEQNQSKYNHKVDIFALGLIYFELIWFMHTKSERRKIWDDVREQNFPKEFSDQFCFEHKLIKEILCDKPAGRPDAKELAPKLKKFTSVLDENGNGRNATV